MDPKASQKRGNPYQISSTEQLLRNGGKGGGQARGNWKYYLKLLKMSEISEILQFLTYINILYIKRKHFSCKIQFHTEKV